VQGQSPPQRNWGLTMEGCASDVQIEVWRIPELLRAGHNVDVPQHAGSSVRDVVFGLGRAIESVVRFSRKLWAVSDRHFPFSF
jgi:hypothetical protein